MSTTVNDARWYGAATLRERLALRRAASAIGHQSADESRGRRRAERWQAEAVFQNGEHFAARLASDGLGSEEWLELLSEPAEAIRDRTATPPAWTMDVVEAYTRSSGAPDPAAFIDVEALRGKARAAAGFWVAVWPLVRLFYERLDAEIDRLRAHTTPALPFDPLTIRSLLAADLPGLLLARLDRTFVLELHVARLERRLTGDTAQERYESFLRSLHDPGIVLAIFLEYPVLARQLWVHLAHWLASAVEFLRRLCGDWNAIRETFRVANPGPLTGVELGAGDRHCRGRAVILAMFGSGFRLVYKPRPLSVDAHFQELLRWLNERGLQPPLRALTVLDRGNYGWLEFAAARPCRSESEVTRFYVRQGSLLALLYVLRATDFHFENVIASGEHPVLVDLETLLHPHLSGAAVDAERLSEKVRAQSVLWSGMLPQRVWGTATSPGIDVSGLGGGSGERAPFGAPAWAEAGTDGMYWTRRPLADMEVGRNRPTLRGADVDVLDHTEEIVKGFSDTYRLLLRHRDEWLGDSGPLTWFAEDEVRVILRPSQRYSVLLHDAFHPDLLHDALDRDQFFDRLWSEASSMPLLGRVIAAERADLERADIPLFTTRPSSRDLWTSAGERLPDVLERSALDQARRGLEAMSEKDLARQTWLVRAALSTLAAGMEGRRVHRSHLPLPERLDSVDADALLGAACAVGDRLHAIALESRDEALWIGLTVQGRALSLGPVDTGLYSGTAGIALFLAYLGHLTRQERYTQLARSAVRAWRRELDTRRGAVTGIGAFEGWGAAVYTLAHLSWLWDESELLTQAHDAADRIDAEVERDDRLDVMGGAAGAIASLLALRASAPSASARLLAIAERCGDHLLRKAQPANGGVAWPSTAEVLAPLTGLAHGAAGNAWALMKLADASREDRFREIALAAIAYERSVFSAEAANWPDWRMDGTSAAAPPQPFFGTGWCHGAPGIGLARLDVLHLLDGHARTEVDIALETTLAQGFGDNHSLCHGDLGNVELVLQAAEILGGERWSTKREHLSASVLDDIGRVGWICGTPRQVESPGLMSGLAGIGYGLLRLVSPRDVPAVLLLAPPPVSSAAAEIVPS
jgi:type 2 lantibiotic biosynthesis protein LanM